VDIEERDGDDGSIRTICSQMERSASRFGIGLLNLDNDVSLDDGPGESVARRDRVKIR
jgi:hypothetical protein